MKKKDKVTYDEKHYFDNNMFSTKYDYLFRDIIRNRGVLYYTNHIVTEFCQTKNKISAVVRGTKDYYVSVEYLENDEIEVKCDCPYHVETDPYCKHVYALLLTLKMIYEKEMMIKVYKTNIKEMKKISKEIETMIANNKKYLDSFAYSWGKKLKCFYDSYLKQMEDMFDKNNDYRLINLVKSSYYYLNETIDDYNKLIDYIEEGKEKTKKKSDNSDVVSSSVLIDDSNIYDSIDNVLDNIDVSILKKVKKEKSNEVLDRAIERKQSKKKQLEKRKKKSFLIQLLANLFSEGNNDKPKDSSCSSLMPWEKELVDKNVYEPYHFEEEDLEDDDYYSEDD